MSRVTIGLDERLNTYLAACGDREHPVAAKLRAGTARLPESSLQIAPEQGQLLAFLARLIMAGSRTATVPVSLMNPESRATAAMMTTVRRVWLSPAMVRMRRPMSPASPVCITAPPTTKRAAMVSTAGLENPAQFC